MNRTTLYLSMLGMLLVSAVGIAQAVPPPLGPPILTASTGTDIGVSGFFTPIVRTAVNTAITSTNNNINAMVANGTTKVKAQVSLSNFTVFAPSLMATQYPDRQNERYVWIPYMVEILIHDIAVNTGGAWVGVPVERKISQTIYMNTFCDQWQTGQGHLKVVADVQRAYLEDEQGTLEQVVNFFLLDLVTPYIDSQVRAQLPGSSNISVTLPGQCDSLGADAGNPNDLTDDKVLFSYHPRRVVATTGLTPFNQVSVKLLSLKRLVAHDMQGAVLYQSVETPALELYANFQHYYAPLSSLQEGQQLTLNVPPLTLTRPGDSDLLVVISNIIQNLPSSVAKNSAFTVFDRSTNFGNGTQTIRIQKSYWVQANPKTGAKPYQVYVDAYELAFQVNAPQPLMNPGTSAGTGTIAPGTVAPIMTVPIMPRGVEGEQPSEPAPGTSGSPEQPSGTKPQ